MSKNAAEERHLPPEVRHFILFLAFVQGVLLIPSGFVLVDRAPFGLALSTLLVTLPTAIALSLNRLDDPRFWRQMGWFALVQLAIVAWAVYSSFAPQISLEWIWLPVIGSLCLLTLVLLPWLQARQQHGSFRVPYALLFEFAWQNTLSLLLALLFTLMGWLVLGLAGGLFALLGIPLIVLYAYVAFPVTCLLFTGGILMARGQPRVVQMLRRLQFALFKVVLPALSLILLLFMLSLPFGLKGLLAKGYGAALFVSLIMLMVLVTNSVWQVGKSVAPYPYPVRRLIDAALLTLPLYAALACYALWLRIDKYGLSTSGFFAQLSLLIASGYALSYAFAVLRSSKGWLSLFAPINKAMAWLIIVLGVLANSPLLDAHRISAASQVARLQQGMDEKILLALRFDNGRAGYQALQALQAEKPEDSAVIGEILARTNRRERSDKPKPEPISAKAKPKADPLDEAHRLDDHLLLAEGSKPPDEDWLLAFRSGNTLFPFVCYDDQAQCVVRLIDLDADGNDEVLLCKLSYSGSWADCYLHAQENGLWRNQGDVSFYESDVKDDQQSLKQLLLSRDALQMQPKRWPMLSLKGAQPRDIRLEGGRR